MFKKIIVVSLFIFPILTFAEKITITIAAFPAVDSIIKEALEYYKKKENVEYKVVSREYADHHTAMTTALATSSALPNIMVIEYSYLGRFAQGGGLQNLLVKPYNAGELEDRFVNFAFEQAKTKKHGLSALPADIGPGSLFYRNDIIVKSGLTQKDLTQSWDSYVAAGKVIKDKTGSYLLAHARDIKDIVIRSNITLGDGVYFDKNGKSLVAKEARFAKAFELAKQVRENELDAKIGAWSTEWGESFRRGTVATQMMGAWLGGHLSNWLAPETATKWRAAPLPDNAKASWGGSFLSIPLKAEHKEIAWDLIKFLALNRDHHIRAFKNYDAFPSLLEVHNDKFFEEPIAFLGGQKARLQWREMAQSIIPTMVFKHDPIAEEIVNSELDLVLNRNKAIKTALQDADRVIQRRARR